MGKILFQVGDRVKLVESSHQHLLGKTYTIIDIENTQCKLEDINGGTVWVKYTEIEKFADGEESPKSVEQYKDEIIKLVKAMNREHGMNVYSLKVETKVSVSDAYGDVQDRLYEVRLEA